MQWSSTRISGPTKNQAPHATRADQLVVDQIRCQPAKSQLAPSLANDLVTGSKAEEMREAFDDDRVAVVNKTADRFFHRT